MMEYTELLTLLVQYKYYLLFPLLIIQGPIVAIVAGFLASQGLFSVTMLCIYVTLADLITDTIVYSVGRWGRWTIIARWGKYIGLTDTRLEKAEIFMEERGHWALVLGKVAYSLGTPTMVLAGISHMKYLKFIFINFLVAVPKSILFVLLGFYVGENIEVAKRYLNYIGIALLILAITVGCVWWKKGRIN